MSKYKVYNELTHEMDKYKKSHLKEREVFDTCILKMEEGLYCFRVTGATRGHIETENYIIKNIEFYRDSCFDKLKCYDEDIVNVVEKYIGKNIREIPISKVVKFM